MAGFEGVHWAPHQMRYLLKGKDFSLLDRGGMVHAVSKSIHYGLFLAFEGIRFFCHHNTTSGTLEVVFLNWDLNLERFRKGISFNLSQAQQPLVPDKEELQDIFIGRYFQDPQMRPFFEEMAELGAQGYFRPFTVDEEQSIGVTFAGSPSIRAVVCRYDRYLGEPFVGVVVPHMIRVVGLNKTGCLKLGVNYLMSVKAVDEAKKVHPDAASALFLDDQPHRPLEERFISEWDSSCCLFGMADGRIIKIPENPLILPSVTIRGITTILEQRGVTVEESHLTYGELLKSVESRKLVVACSVGTAGILNRCQELLLVDAAGAVIAVHKPREDHPLFAELGLARDIYWDIYRGTAPVPPGQNRATYRL